MAWHRGFSLPQTLFASYYIDRLIGSAPDSLEEATFHANGKKQIGNELLHVVLRAYCLALIKCCDLVYQQIISAPYKEVSR